MQAGVFGGICLLAFLLSEGRAEESELSKESNALQAEDKVKEKVGLRKSGDLEAPGDLKSELSLGVAQSNSRANEGRSGDITQIDARRDSAVINAVAQSSGDGYASAYANSFSDSTQSKATDLARGAPALTFNPFNEELGPYKPPGSSLSQAETQTPNSDSYDQRLNYNYAPSYPYQTEADNGLYQPSPNANPETDTGLYQRDSAYNPYGQGFNPAQAQNQANNDLYQQDHAYNTYSSGLSTGQAQYQADNGLYQPGYNVQPNMSPYSQGTRFAQEPGQSDSESKNPIIKPKPMLSKSAPLSDSFSAIPSYFPYNPVPGDNAAHTQDNSGPYQPIPVPSPDFSPYERFLVPHKGSSSIQTRGNSDGYKPVPIIKSKEDRYEANPRSYNQGPNLPYSYGQKEPYQAIPQPDPNRPPYESYLVPYRQPKVPQAQIDNDEYQPIPIPKPSNEQQEAIARLYSERFHSSHSNNLIHKSPQPQTLAESRSYETISSPDSESKYPNMVPYIESNYSQKQMNNGVYQPISKKSLRTIPTQDKINPYQSIPVPESDLSRYEPSIVQSREENSRTIKLQDESKTYEYRPVSNANDLNSDDSSSSSDTIAARSRENNPVKNDIDLTADPISKNGWNPYQYIPYTPSGAYPQLYPSGAEAAQTYPDNKPAASGVTNLYSQGINPYANDYPSESPVRLGRYNPAEYEAQKQPGIFASGQSSPIAFDDAKSRAIMPHEYVFPNKMPGGENVIQCSKENEFHHFWSKELECLVCICLNEYGILQPVCASCGGCQNPPPKLPEPVPRLPESITVQPPTPGPFEPIPIMPEPFPTVPQPEQPVPTPEPYPVYPTPEPVTLPPPITFPEPVATLPPPPESAHCNPLPTGVPFTNPLHPCQLCICRETLVSGRVDVQIECKENPQCIAPADVTALPPLPDVPMPIPLPICEKFPENVLFPHPTETCKLCKCAKSLPEDGVVEQQITCYPHPDCIPKVEPITEPAVPSLPMPVDPSQVKPTPEPLPTEPLREPFQPMEPVPLPEIVTVEPLPWPPITTIAPVPALPVTPKPGPLPGPSPHESCRPFPPNQTFQHPWDECQICLCTEAVAVGLITVEVNCYTKPSCCIEPPDSITAALPGKQLLFIGLNTPYLGPTVAVTGPDDGSQPTTSTYRPPSAYPSSYSPKSVNIYPGSNQAPDPLNPPPVAPFSGFVDSSSSYPYQPNYAPQYVNPQYPEFPPRLQVLPGSANTIGQYKPNNFGYPPNYQYAQGDAVGSNYLPQSHFQPFDPRFQTVPAPTYPGMYQRAYERPPIFAPQLRENYVKPPIPAIGGPSVQNLAPKYGAPKSYSKSGKGGPDGDSR